MLASVKIFCKHNILSAPHSGDFLHAVGYLVHQLARDLTISHFVSPYLFVSGPLCALHTDASLVSPSTVPVPMVLNAANRLVDLCDTTPSATSLNERWHRQMFLHCWNPGYCVETSRWSLCSTIGQWLLPRVGLHVSGYSCRQSLEPCRAELKCCRK